MGRMMTVAMVWAGVTVATPLIAQTTPAPPQATDKKARDPNQMVCEKQAVPGSRLAFAKVCKTRAEWADLRGQDRMEVERVQVQRGDTNH